VLLALVTALATPERHGVVLDLVFTGTSVAATQALIGGSLVPDLGPYVDLTLADKIASR
jgi:hypothetical protein